MEREAVTVSAVRTPFGRYGGVLKSVRPDDLAAIVINRLCGSGLQAWRFCNSFFC